MTDRSDSSLIQADFDRLAAFSREEWDHNSHSHRFLLRQVPPHCHQVVELGYRSGTFARLLATRAEPVLALDVSPQMIRLARERSRQYANSEFQVADAVLWEFPVDHFDCIVSIATLHHLPLEAMLTKMTDALSVNGVLLILDLYQESLIRTHLEGGYAFRNTFRASQSYRNIFRGCLPWKSFISRSKT